MSFALLVMVLLVFLYLISRLNSLEARIKKMENGSIFEKRTDVVRAPIPGPIPDHVVPAPKIAGPATAFENDRGLEFKLGGKFFTVIGAVAVLFGVGFFLRYAFEQNLITESMRVALGAVASAILIGVGEYLKKQYSNYSQILQGTGVGVLYLTFFAAYNFYGLLSQPAALMGMIVVTLFGVFLGVRANSQALSGVAQAGAYLTPFLLGLPDGNPHLLFVYIALVNFGVLLLALWKTWRNVTLGSLLGTALVFLVWHSESYSDAYWQMSMAYLTLFFLTFLSANVYRYFIQRHMSDENDLALVAFNPMFYFVASYSVLSAVNNDYAGYLAFVLAALYFGLGISIPSDNPNAKIFHFGVASTLAFVGVPLVFDKEWITIGWAAEGAFLLYYGLLKNWRGLQYLAHLVFMVASFRLLVFDLTNFQGDQPVFNGRALTFFIVVGLLSAMAYFTYKKGQRPSEDSTVASTPALVGSAEKGFEALVIQAHLIALFWTGSEIIKFGNTHWMGIVWAALGLIVLGLGMSAKNYELRVLAYLTALLAVLRVVLFDSDIELAGHQPLLNLRTLSYAGTAGILALMALLANESKKDLRADEIKIVPRMFFGGVNLLLLGILSLEISSYFDKQLSRAAVAESAEKYRSVMNSKRAAMSVAWSMYAGLLLVLGIAKKSVSARLLSMGLFSVVIFKVFLYDTSNLSNFYRFVSFISLGIILLLAGYLYNRYKDRIEGFIKVEDTEKI